MRHSSKTPICIDYAGGKPPYETCIAPKFGNVEEKIKNRPHIAAVSFSTLNKYIDAGILDPKKKIDIRAFVESKLVPRRSSGIRLLTSGMADFKHKIDIEVNTATNSAIERVRFLGGSITLFYIDKDRIDYYRDPNNFFFEPPRSLPETASDLMYYSNPKMCGFLAKYISSDDTFEESVDKLKKLHDARQEEIIKRLHSLPDFPKSSGNDHAAGDPDCAKEDTTPVSIQ